MKRLWEMWKSFGRKLGDFQARLILTIFYFLIIGPFALAVRVWGDPLTLRPGSTRGWIVRTDGDGTPIERASKQF